MKKILLVLVLASMFIAGPALGGDYMKAKKYLTFKWTGVDLDHTYHCAKKTSWWGSSSTSCWSWTGGQSGGSYLSGTAGYGDYGDSKCTSKNWGCRFIYGVNGVCHMESNRGLYTSRKTVHNAKGYWLSSALYGTYGNAGTWTICKTACWLWW
jgi:hypothetical protein